MARVLPPRRLALAAVLPADGAVAATTRTTVSIDDPSWSVTLADPPLTLTREGTDRKLAALAVLSSGEAIETLLLRVCDGYLSAIEYGWVTDEPPVKLPAACAVRDVGADAT